MEGVTGRKQRGHRTGGQVRGIQLKRGGTEKMNRMPGWQVAFNLAQGILVGVCSLTDVRGCRTPGVLKGNPLRWSSPDKRNHFLTSPCEPSSDVESFLI